MRNKFIWLGSIISMIMIGTAGQTSAQINNEAALAAADTSGFSINNQGGWQLYNSYVAAAAADSIQLEIILQHDNNLNWSNSIYIGRIKGSSFYPQNDRLVSFNLINTMYELKVDKNGKCYLRLVSGNLSGINTVVIPIQLFYKK